MSDSLKVGCLLLAFIVFVGLIILPLAALKYQNDQLETRIEALEKP